MTTTASKLAFMTAAGATAIFFISRSLKKGQKAALNKDDATNLDPQDCIQPEDVTAIFDDLFLHMQSVLAQLSQQIQQIQMAGQSIPEAQLRQILKSEFERALLAKQKSIFDKHDVDEVCLQEATWEFLNDPDEYPAVKKSVERFQKLYENVTGEKTVGKRPGQSSALQAEIEDVSKDQLLRAAGVYFDALTSAMGEIVVKFKMEGKDLMDPNVAQQLQMEFAGVANDSGEKALEMIGISMDSFKAAIEKHSSDPEVGRSLAKLQMKQQQELMALGVPTM
mmetsp:Transcript_6786/g.12770  ORF Transcript_6786/g.12770 Transcript_6786/m.12770 type:complete len:280 (+) Transcript_6786:129-968(+)